jgi:hypothetical protein
MTSEVKRIYVACFGFDHSETEDGLEEKTGTFAIVLEAADRDDALERCRARLDEMSAGSDLLGTSVVFLSALVETSLDALGRGVMVHHVSMDRDSVWVQDDFPVQQARNTNIYFDEDLPGRSGEPADDAEEARTAAPFWTGHDASRPA